MPSTSSVRKRFQFTGGGTDSRGARSSSSTAPRHEDYWTVSYLPLTILKMWNFAPARSPLDVNEIGVPRMVDLSETFANAARSDARLILPLPAVHAFVAAVAYICART